MSKASEARSAWEAANGRKAGRDDYYDAALERWVHPLDGEDMAAVRAGGPLSVSVRPDCSFVSTSLPKNYKLHADRGGQFTADGACIIENRRQLENLVRSGNAQGEGIAYAGPGEIYPD